MSDEAAPAIEAVGPGQRPRWTLDRLRTVLTLHKASAMHLDGRPQTWRGICEAIAEVTQVEIPHERLRQFVEGVKGPDGVSSFPIPRADRIEAVIRWATDPADPQISLAELERPDHAVRAPLCLPELLVSPDQQLPSGAPLPSAKLFGRYVAVRSSEDLHEEIELVFEPYPVPEICHVREVHRQTELRPVEGIAPVSYRPDVESVGWAVTSGEDQVLVFLRTREHGLNHRWILIEDADLLSDRPVADMTFLRQSFPYDRDDDETLHASLVQNLYRFRRSEPDGT